MQGLDVRRVVVIGLAGLGGVLVLAVLALYGLQQGRTLPNTLVAGVDVGRLTGDEVRAELVPLVEARQSEPLAFTFEDATFPLVPVDVGYAVDLDTTVEVALGRGRDDGIGGVLTRVRSLWTTKDLPLEDAYDPAAVVAWVDDVAAEVDREVWSGAVVADPRTLEVGVSLPHGSATVRRDDARELIVGLLASAGSATAELPVDTTPALVADADVDAVAVQVERALEGGIELTAGEESLGFAPPEIATLIEVVERPTDDGATLELTVSHEELATIVGDVGDRFATEPVDARFVTSRAPPVSFDVPGSTSFAPVEAPAEIEPGLDGTRFDLELLAEQLTDMVREGRRTADLALVTEEPQLTTARAEEVRPTHLLGTFTTYHPAGQARVVNIQRLADRIDNAVLFPGEQFSINGISGRRTCAGGYLPAGTIIAGELKDSCGGGTSQLATTTLNAAFFSGLQLDQWKAHSWYFSRYPLGREATLDYPALDVKFTNTSDAVVILRTSYTPGSITVSIYGQPVASRVVAEHGGRFAPRPFREEIRETDERCEGDDRVLQDGEGGFTVNVVRQVDAIDGSSDRQDIRTVYVPRTKIIEAGARDCTPDEPEEDEPDDEGAGAGGGDADADAVVDGDA